ncbi:hypothetical protein EYF80_015580 [Liparis tanakae]|uniref:Uncharacterized protein n=1 Tax=Liparis tanakae TaxID=230148 RepID=A0A4Z2I9R0_9TELE|nr:hypothetical protein EYF80_015580 [Liparis tanakae]
MFENCSLTIRKTPLDRLKRPETLEVDSRPVRGPATLKTSVRVIPLLTLIYVKAGQSEMSGQPAPRVQLSAGPVSSV